MRSDFFRKYLLLSRTDRSLIVEACCYVAVAKIVSKLVPFRQIARVLRRQIDKPALTDVEAKSAARAIGWAVATVSRRRPIRTVCLGQAISAHLMLKRRSIPSTLYLGVAKDGEKLIAHAWTAVDDLIVTGAAGHENFTVVSKLSSLPL